MNFVVYILFSETKNKFYIAFTPSTEERLILYNQKSKGFKRKIND